MMPGMSTCSPSHSASTSISIPSTYLSIRNGCRVDSSTAAELGDQAGRLVGAGLVRHPVAHARGVERLEVEPAGRVEVGAHRLRIAVHHDAVDAALAQRLGGVDGTVVELDALPDADRAGA